jgi:hypothetical protein
MIMSTTKEPSSLSNIFGCGVSSHSQSILIVDCESDDTPKSTYTDQQNTYALSISLLNHLLLYKIVEKSLGSSKIHDIKCHCMA